MTGSRGPTCSECGALRQPSSEAVATEESELVTKSHYSEARLLQLNDEVARLEEQIRSAQQQKQTAALILDRACLTIFDPLSKLNGRWFITISGKRVSVEDPRPEDICLRDIAHALSHICRFGGHVKRFYSVAEHSVLVSRLVPRQWARQGLLHDTMEAYIGDVISPLKALLPEYKKIEAKWEAVLAQRFGLPEHLDPSVKQADLVALVTEQRDLTVTPNDGLPDLATILGIEPADHHVCEAWSPDLAYTKFLTRFAELSTPEEAKKHGIFLVSGGVVYEVDDPAEPVP